MFLEPRDGLEGGVAEDDAPAGSGPRAKRRTISLDLRACRAAPPRDPGEHGAKRILRRGQQLDRVARHVLGDDRALPVEDRPAGRRQRQSAGAGSTRPGAGTSRAGGPGSGRTRRPARGRRGPAPPAPRRRGPGAGRSRSRSCVEPDENHSRKARSTSSGDAPSSAPASGTVRRSARRGCGRTPHRSPGGAAGCGARGRRQKPALTSRLSAKNTARPHDAR